MQETIRNLADQFAAYAPSILAALVILVVGWLVALAISALVRTAINRTAIGDSLAGLLRTEETAEKPPIGNWVGKALFYVLMVFVVVAAFQALSITAVVDPLNHMLQQFTGFLPNLVGASVLFLVSWGIGAILRALVTKGLGQTTLDEKFTAGAGMEPKRPVSQTLGDVVFFLPILLFLPAVLGALGMHGLLEPVQAMFDKAFAMLPNVAAAAFILFVGWFVARMLRQIVSSLLAASGVDNLGERVGMGTAAGKNSLSSVIGLVVYALILIPAAIAALDALKMESISQPATRMLESLLAAVPLIFGAGIILGISFMIGKLVSALVTSLLSGAGFDRVFEKLGLKIAAGPKGTTPSQVVGYLVLVGIILLAAIEAADLLGFATLSTVVTEFFTFANRLLLGLVIFGVGLYLA
ncbi:MAG: mechanosensitive ion channel, partial [Gemmatimonadales bacterium]|nr:mechanosensitive ion channel [Gemmatimonadales bacterium]